MTPPVHKSVRPLGVVAGAAMLLLGAAGCSTKQGENPNLVAGKQQFVAKCGSCHTLARAGTKGVIGPNLDDAFRASLAAGLGRSSIRGVVAAQIQNPNPFGAMPKNLVHGANVNDVASYVERSADQSGPDTGLLATAVPVAGAGKPALEVAGKLQIDADPNGQLAYTTTKAAATAGPVTIVMKNASTVQHNIAIQQGTNGAVLGAGPVVSGGATSTVKLSLTPGTYTYFCQVPGHRAAGMMGTLVVK